MPTRRPDRPLLCRDTWLGDAVSTHDAPDAPSYVLISHCRLGEARVYITFPAPTCLSVLAFARNLRFGLLLRHAKGSVWFLRCPHPWSEERIQIAARKLAEKPVPGLTRAELEMRLAYALELPSIEIADPPLDENNEDAWGVRLVATAAVLKFSSGEDARHLAAELTTTELSMREQLRRAAFLFTSSLDAEALDLARGPAGFNVLLYNFLADSSSNYGIYRKQFARTFPLLARAAAMAYPGSEAFGLRQAVDNGLPIVRYLSRTHGVSASCVRSLSGVGPELAGGHWQERYGIVLRLLDALCPEHRPGRAADAWANFNAAIELAERRFRRKAHTSPLALSWLRATAKNGWANLQHDRGDGTAPSAIAAVDLLRKAAVRVFSDQASTGSRAAVDSVMLITQTVDRFLLGYGSRRLIEHARAFEVAVASAQAGQEDKSQVLDGAFWPFMPMERQFGRRLVRPLTSREVLRQHGQALGICLGYSQLDVYATSCANGKAFLVGLYDIFTDTPLSTARFRLTRDMRDGRFRPELAEFAGRENSPPGEDCRQAVRELINAASEPALQQHWNMGWRVLDEIRRLGRDEARARMERRIFDASLRGALGASGVRLRMQVQRAIELNTGSI